jgi:protein-disulfide isomerase
MNQNSISLKWYQKSWVVLVGGFLVLVLVLGLVLGGYILHYYIKIKHGEATLLSDQFSGAAFTKSANRDRVKNLPKADRQVLEGGNFPHLGSSNPQVTIVEFVDFKCPYCKQMVSVMDEILKKYGSKVKIIVRHFPAESLHPGATQLSEIAYCSGKQGKFWQLYYYFYTNQDSLPEQLSQDAIDRLVGQFGLNNADLVRCMSDQATAVAINQDYTTGYNLGVEGTPTYFVNGERVEGAMSFQIWDNFLKQF